MVRALLVFIVGLLLAIGFLTFRLYSVDKDRDERRTWQEDVAHATRVAADKPMLSMDQVGLQIGFLGQGITTLKGKVNEHRLEAEKNAALYEQAKATAEKRGAELDRLGRTTQQSINRLRQRINNPTGEFQCPVPEDLLNELEGL